MYFYKVHIQASEGASTRNLSKEQLTANLPHNEQIYQMNKSEIKM